MIARHLSVKLSARPALLSGRLLVDPDHVSAGSQNLAVISGASRKPCVVCHRANDIAPMSLMTYKDTRPWARAIRDIDTTKLPWSGAMS